MNGQRKMVQICFNIIKEHLVMNRRRVIIVLDPVVLIGHQFRFRINVLSLFNIIALVDEFVN